MLVFKYCTNVYDSIEHLHRNFSSKTPCLLIEKLLAIGNGFAKLLDFL